MKSLLALLLAFSLQAQQMLPLSSSCDQVVTHGGYTLCYSEKHEQARWVAYDLTVKNLMCKGRRKNNFRHDTDIVTGSATIMDYFRSGYDRGHLAPVADFKCDMPSTFFMSNISPQVPMFNRGVWRRLERWVRDKAGELRIVTGPVLSDSLKTIGYNEVSVPDYYYKVVLGSSIAIGFIMPNKASIRRVESFAVSIDSVEKFVDMDFYADLPDSIEVFLESVGRM